MKELIKKNRQDIHQEVQEILPWFVNGSLSDRERVKVMAHLTDCEVCRAERDQLQQLQDQVAADDEPAGDYQPAFNRLMARIDAAEDNRASTRDLDPPDREGTHRPQWIAFAAAACLMLGVYMIIALPGGENSDPGARTADEFNTLNIAPTSRPGAVKRLALTFEQPLQAETLRAAFIETGSYIVSGPDAEGRYIVEMRVPEAADVDEFLNSIQAIDGVKYAVYLP